MAGQVEPDHVTCRNRPRAAPPSPFPDALFFRVHDLNPTVLACEWIRFILQLGLAIAHGDKGGGGNLETIDEVALDRVGALLGEVLVSRKAALGVGMTGKDKSAALELRVRKRLSE